VGAVPGCAVHERYEVDVVRIVGSDTMWPLAERWATAFMERHPGTVVRVEGGGTGAGIAALVAGRADLATGSRPLLPEEVQELNARHASLGVSYRCARDALSIYVNPSNPVRDMSLLQLKGLFAGRIGTWSKVGGRDEPVHVLVRPPNSGTYRLFQELVLTEEAYSSRAVTLPTTAAIVDAVTADEAAIGYGGVVFGQDLVHCSIDGQAPTPRSVRDGSYPLGRYLYLHAVRPPRGRARDLVDFVFSPEGQRLVEEVGFLALWEAPPSEGSPDPAP